MKTFANAFEIDEHLGYSSIKDADGVTIEVTPKSGFRWCNGVLQQAFAVEKTPRGQRTVATIEWRAVPIVGDANAD
jgi:hypothetical protein